VSRWRNARARRGRDRAWMSSQRRRRSGR
jgi:hypothetical protein